MNIEQLDEELQGQLSGGILILENTVANESAYAMLFSQTGGGLALRQCALRREGEEITASGSTFLPLLAKGKTANAKMQFRIQRDRLHFKLAVAYSGVYALPDFLGGSYTMYVEENGLLHSDTGALEAVHIIDPVVSAQSEAFERIRPLSLMGGVHVDRGAWDMYADWLQTGLYFSAELSLIPVPPFEGASWSARIGLQNNSLMAKILKDFMPGADAWVELKGGRADTWGAQIVSAQLACLIEPPSLGTPVAVRAPLFFGSAYWEFAAEMRDGLSIANLLSLVSGLLHLKLDDGAMPSGLLFSNLRLYELGLGYCGRPYSLAHGWLRMGSSAVTGLGVSGLELVNARLSLEADFEEGTLQPSEWRISVSAMLRLELYNGLELWLKAGMEIPELLLEAELSLARRREAGVPLDGLIGTEAANALSGALTGAAKDTRLAGLAVMADIPRRNLHVSGSLYDVLNWQIGKIRFTVEEVNVAAAFEQEAFAFQIEGIFRLALSPKDYFIMGISGGYGSGEWSLSAKLVQGQIDIGQLLLAMLDVRYTSPQSVFVLKEFALSFTTGKNEFSLEAAFYNDWGTILNGVKVASNGRFMLRTSKDMPRPFLAVLLGLEIGPFALSTQINDFFDEEKAGYIFQAAVGGHILRAVYAKKMVDGKHHQQLTVEFANTTLGDIVRLLAGAVNPNHRHELPAPWNLLDKINLSKLHMVYDLTDESIAVVYSLNLSIPGIFTVTQVGLSYRKHSEGSGLRFILSGKAPSSSQEQTCSWDVIDEMPPADLAQNDNRFVLYYLGMGQHFSTPQIRASGTIRESIAAMKESFTLERLQFDTETDWILGLHFSLQNMLDFRLVFYDPLLYGVEITVAASKPPLDIFNGLGLILLYKKISKDIGMFKVTLQLPQRYRRLQLGALSFTIGLLDLEVYTNRDFKLDLGFPANRDFSRSFSLEAGMYVGRGGLYFGALSGATAKELPVTDKGTFCSVVSLGVGLSLGIGRSFDFSVVKGGVSLEMYGIFEGIFAVFQPIDEKADNALYYHVSAAVGLVGRLWLCADLKIITVNASVEIEAYAAVEMEACRPMELTLELKLRLEASIKILFIRIKFSFHFQARLQVTIGSGSTPPWADALPQKASPLERSKLYCTKSLRTVRQELILQAAPVFSRAENDVPVIALIPVLEIKEFRLLAALLADWTLEAYGEIITPETTSMYGFAFIAERVDYRTLVDFLSRNIVLRLSSPAAPKNGETQETVAMAMPPAARIKVQADETDILTVDYWRDNMVDGAYALRLDEYFRRLYPKPAEPSAATQDGTEQAPLAQLVFLDYFQMLLRQIKGSLDCLFNEITLPADILPELQEVCGVTPYQALRQNRSLRIEPYTDIHTGCRLAVLPGESLNGLAARAGLTLEDIIGALYKTKGLLDNDASCGLPESGFINRSCITLRQAAALFFERYFRNEIPDGWQEYVQPVIEANHQCELDLEWRHSQAVTLHLPGSADWLTMPGDTVSGLARMLFLLDKGCGAFESFAEEVYRRNGGTAQERPQEIRIPGAEVGMAGEQTLDTLLSRLFPDGASLSVEHPLALAPILKAGWEVETPVAVSLSEEAAAADVAEMFGISLDSISQMLAAHPERIAKNQTLRITGIPMLQKKWAAYVLKQDAFCDELGMLASRFMLQGSRLPCPQGEGTKGFYELLFQQAPLVEEAVHLVTLEAGEPECAWLQGESRKEYAWAMIADELPVSGFAWNQYLRTACQADDLRSIAACYNPGAGFALCGNGMDGLRLFPADERLRQDLPQISRLCVLDAGKMTETKARAAIYLPIYVRQTGKEYIYETEGAPPSSRAALRALAEACGADTADWQLCYPPSPLQKSGVLFAPEWDRQGSMLLRTNLSTVTHYHSVGRAAAAEMQDAAALDDEAALTMLWECSTVGGRGFRLYLKDTQGAGLTETLFDGEGRAEIWLIGFDRTEQGPVCKSGYANAVLAAAEENAAFYAASGEICQSCPALPAGCVGVDIRLTAPDAEDESPLAKSRRLFNIINYELQGEGYRPVETATPLPPEKEAEGCWHYKLTLPLYQMLENGGQSPYAALGTAPSLWLRCTDVLGNYAAQKGNELLLSPVYNDRLYGLNEWPCTALRFRIEEAGGQAQFLLELAVTEENKPGNPAASVEMLERSLCQLSETDVEARLTCTMGNQEWPLDAETVSSILSYGNLLRAYLLGETGCPEPLVLPFAIARSKLSGIFPLTAAIVLQRTRYLPRDASLCTARTEILPDIQPEEGQGMRPAYDFALAFERAVPGVKLARPDRKSAALYVVTVGSEGALPRLTIRPVQIQGITAPTYSAVRPLHNRQISRNLEVRTLDREGNWADEGKKLRLSGIDMDVWKANLLQDAESLLNHENAFGLALKKPGLYNSLTKAKRELARTIPEGLIPLNADSTAKNQGARALFTESLGVTLLAEDSLACIAEYALIWENPAPERLRMEVTLVSEHEVPEEEKIFEAYPCKLETDADSFCIQYTAASPLLTGYVPDNRLRITELEYHISANGHGYESSSWLQFIIPLESGGEILDADLTSGLRVPNPLRRCPANPALLEQKAVFDEDVLYNWRYELTCAAELAEQDRYQIEVAFSKRELLQTDERQDLFACLACYNENRSVFRTNLFGPGGNALLSTAERFAELLQEAADLWRDWLCREEMPLQVSPDTYYAQVNVTFHPRPELHVSSSWENADAVFGTESPAAGVMTPFLLRMPNINVYRYHVASSAIQTVRNADLLNTQEGRSLAVSEYFIYRSQRLVMPELYAGYEETAEITVGSVTAGDFENAVSQAVECLFETLGTDGQQVQVSMAIMYAYRLGSSYVELPVGMLLPTAAGRLPDLVYDTVIGWRDKYAPGHSAFALIFRVNVHHPATGEVLLGYARLRINLILSIKP